MAHKVPAVSGKRVGVIVSGGNADPAVLAQVLEGGI
jgi:threonine dehydratase